VGKSGHWENYRENMFIVEVDEEGAREKVVNALKPMNCPCHVQIFNVGLKSYRDLPLRMAEFGSCARYEPSGALHGIMRVRGFHPGRRAYLLHADQIESESRKFIEFLLPRSIPTSASTNGGSSCPPGPKSVSDEIWDKMEAALANAVRLRAIPMSCSPAKGPSMARSWNSC
jgi:threonyl-tRNA synthetase